MPPTEQNVAITPGAGAGIDTINVGPGAVGTGSEALRQVLVIGDPENLGAVAGVNLDGAVLVRDRVLLEILEELQKIRLGISILIGQDLD
jgi:hypothetical protein